jgi:hypothetical protein
MLMLSEHIETLMTERNKQWLFEARLNYLASEIMETLMINDAEEITSSLNRAFLACDSLHIPFHRNFERVFCYDGENMIEDWKISPLAYYLIIINCNPRHESVAKAQLYFATRYMGQTK